MEKLKRMMVIVLSCFMFMASMTASVSAEDALDSDPGQTAEELVEESAPVAEDQLEEALTEEEEPALIEEDLAAEEPSEEVIEVQTETAEAVEPLDAEKLSPETLEAVKRALPGGAVSPLAEPGDDGSHIGATKTVRDDDGDGVYEMALTVTGQSTTSSSTQVDKSNVIIVMDRSNSMSGTTYIEYVYDAATYNSNTEYYRRRNNGEYSRVYYRNGAWRTSNSNNGTIHSGTVYIGTTRINAEQAALDDVVKNLLANNTPGDPVLSDVIEISIIGYALYSPFRDDNDNVVTGTQISNSADYDAIMSAVNNDAQRSGTNWDDALREALREANALKAAEPQDAVHIVFLTDGEPTASHGDTNYSTGEANYWRHWGNANTQAKAIVNAGYNFYSIFTYGSNNTYINYLNNLTRSAHGVGSYTQNNFGSTNTYHENFYNATDTSQLVAAFDAIVNKIQSNVGYAGVDFEDGVTVGVTNTSVTVDGSINTDSFRYAVLKGNTVQYTVKFTTSGSTTTATFTVNGAEYTTSEAKTHTADLDGNGTDETYTYYSVTVNGTEYKMAPASMDAEGLVDWELAGLGILENGWTYKLTFDVWPNQLAYDMVADLNNGVKTLSDIETVITADQGADVWDQIEKAIIVTYKDPDTGETVSAALNTLSDDIKSALNAGTLKATYSVLTNYSQKVSYYTADEEIDEETGEVIGTSYTPHDPYYPEQPGAVALTSTSMDLEKVWDDSLDESQLNELLWNDYDSEEPSDPTKYQVPLIIWKSDEELTVEDVAAKTEQISEANNLTSSSTEAELKAAFSSEESFYMAKLLGWDEEKSGYSWMSQLEVAPGTLVTLESAQQMGITIVDSNIVSYEGTDYYIVESGHYYTVSEISIDRHFELNTIVYHPMLLNRIVQNVTFTDQKDANGHIIIESIDAMSSVNAYNTLKGGINVRKQIVDFDGEEVTASDDQFTLKVTMKDPEGAAYTDFDYRIFYGENNPKYQDTENYPKHRTGHVFGTAANEDTSTEATTDAEPGENSHTVLNNTDGVVEITLYVGDTLRVINVPAGVTYSVEETAVNEGTIADSDYALVQVDYEIAKGSSAEANYKADTANDQGTYTVVGNAANRATVINKVPVATVELLKEDADSKEALEGVEFKLYSAYTTADAEDNYQVVKDAYGNAIGTDGLIATDADGKISLGGLTAGTYYLVETKTNAGYTLLDKPIKFVLEKVDADGNMTASATDMEGNAYDAVTVTFDAGTTTFTLTVDNEPEYFYVYHSADKLIERISLDDARVTAVYDAASNSYSYTFNIAEETKSGYLYGGYYKSYDGASMSDQEIIDAKYAAPTAAPVYAYKAHAAGNSWTTDTAGTAYTGALANQWSKTEFYEESGLAMSPANGKVYYLKEVDDTKYLQPYTHYTYYKAAPQKIANLWMISDLDDINYKKTGFIITTDDEAKVCVSLTVTNQVGGASVKLTPQKVFKAKGVTSNNYLTYCQEDGSVATASVGKGLSDLRSGSADVTMYWITPDNVFVTSAVQRTVTGDGTKANLAKIDNPVSSTIKAAE